MTVTEPSSTPADLSADQQLVPSVPPPSPETATSTPSPAATVSETPPPPAPSATPTSTTTTQAQQVDPEPAAAGAYYANCSEARAAGAAPLYAGDPGYRGALDRDKDSVACE